MKTIINADDPFLLRWLAVVAILVALFAWLDQPRAPICATDSRWPCPKKGATP